MSLAFSDANVTFAFEGLAIYNLNENNWEFLFLRHLMNHELKVQITRKYTTDGHAEDNKLVHSFKIAKQHNILIEANESVDTPGGKTRFETANFNWQNGNKADLRWMEGLPEELEVEHTSCSFNRLFPKEELSFLSIQGKSILYTHKLSDDDYEIWERDGSQKSLIGIRRLGTIVAADMKYPADSTIKFNIEGANGFSLELKIEGDSNYEIKFDNSCEGNPTCENIDDYQYYYDLLSSSNGKTIEAVPKLVASSTGLMRPGETAACRCRTCRNLVGLDSLRELLNP